MSDITTRLDDASEEAIREIKRLRSELFSLRSEVERLTAEVEKLRPHSIVREALNIAVIMARCEGANAPSATERGFWQEYADTVNVLLKRLEGEK